MSSKEPTLGRLLGQTPDIQPGPQTPENLMGSQPTIPSEGLTRASAKTLLALEHENPEEFQRILSETLGKP